MFYVDWHWFWKSKLGPEEEVVREAVMLPAQQSVREGYIEFPG